jgi:hypothetical protein
VAKSAIAGDAECVRVEAGGKEKNLFGLDVLNRLREGCGGKQDEGNEAKHSRTG